MKQHDNYYWVLADPYMRERWFPDEPLAEDGSVIDAREFTQGRRYSGPNPVLIPLAIKKGLRPEFTFAAFDMPVVSERVGKVLEAHCPHEIQRIPVRIDTLSGYEILNITVTISCINENLSVVTKWKCEDGRPEKVGEYRMISELMIDPSFVREVEIFRIKGWEIALIVSEKVKQTLEKLPNIGVIFQVVT
jgi:hypothetical protein